MDLMDILKDKSQVIKYLLNSIANADKVSSGLRGMKERGFTEQGMIDKVVEVSALQAEQIKAISTIVLIYVANNNFDGDVAHLLNKFGRGEEALQQMFKNKFG